MFLFEDGKTSIDEELVFDYIKKLNEILYEGFGGDKTKRNEVIQNFFVNMFNEVTSDIDIDNPLGSYSALEAAIVEKMNKDSNSIFDFEKNFNFKKFVFVTEVKEKDKVNHVINPAFKKSIANMSSDKYQECLYYTSLQADEINKRKDDEVEDRSITEYNKDRANILKDARKDRGIIALILDWIFGRLSKENKMMEELESVAIEGNQLDEKTMTLPKSVIEYNKIKNDFEALDKFEKARQKRKLEKHKEERKNIDKKALKLTGIDTKTDTLDMYSEDSRDAIEVNELDSQEEISNNVKEYPSIFAEKLIFKDEMNVQDRFFNFNQMVHAIRFYKEKENDNDITEEELGANYEELIRNANKMGMCQDDIDYVIESVDVEKALSKVHKYSEEYQPINQFEDELEK